MILYKTDEEIELLRKSNLIVSKTLALVGSMLRPGMTGKQIDDAAEEFIRDNGGVPGFKGYNDFPASLCVSPNAQVVHGIPTKDLVFRDGDIVSVDCGVILNGFNGDAAYTFPIGNVKDEIMKLLRVTNESLYRGIKAARIGNRIGDIGFAVQDYTERKNNYGVVRELVGHGVGRDLHEAPEVPNYGKRGRGLRLRAGLTIAIEPMINLGKKYVETSKDGWSIYTKDRTPSAHFEHSIAIRKNGPDILSDHSFIEAALDKNEYIIKRLREAEVEANI